MNDIYLVSNIYYENLIPIIAEVENNKNKDYTIYFSTDGGSATASLYFRSWLKRVGNVKRIICIGDIFSGGSIILCGINHIERIAYPYITFLIHSVRISPSDSMISFEEQCNYNECTIVLEKTILDIYKKNLKLDDDILEKLGIGYTYYFDAFRAKEIGLIDRIIPIKDVI